MARPADELESRCCYRNGEPYAMLSVFFVVRPQWPIHRSKYFIGKRRQGRQKLGTPYDDSLTSAVDNTHGSERFRQFCQAERTVDLGVTKGMGQTKISFSDELVIVTQVI